MHFVSRCDVTFFIPKLKGPALLLVLSADLL
jgi:hypothetical protein